LAPVLTYRGRFAPTPSGPLHLGSLLTALASWLQARSLQGRWLLRIDDLDRERCIPGAADAILRQLDAHGLHWDEVPRCQAQHLTEYVDALRRLRATDRVYACACTRAQLKVESLAGPDGPVYCGRCRDLGLPEAGHALRLRVSPEEIAFADGWQGRQWRSLERDIGDFAIRRRDGAPAYQLACAVDESAQGITEVVRGTDLLGSTFMQLHLMDLLGLRRPQYRHLPVLTTADGRKLSKQNHAAPIEAARAGANLRLCLGALGQCPPPELDCASVAEILAWATRNWTAARIPARSSIKVEQIG
jgi:glutamyl-Q tRNA(Asp) synthetase